MDLPALIGKGSSFGGSHGQRPSRDAVTIEKESDVEAIKIMKQEIVDAIPMVIGIISKIIKQRTKKGEKVLLAGIGDTLGIGQ